MAQAAPDFTIFYAWQSDTPAAHNRNLIEAALKEARNRLNADASVPYTISVTSDTKGIPGLCDIPAEILKKIETADAVVLDLTFVAKTAARRPKHCPNPNVLFELGFAFHAVGYKRLICVMNEAHGPATKTFFDIAHRRRPVRFTSPATGKSSKQIVSALAGSLVNALKPTLLLGPQSHGVDETAEFEREVAQIEEQWRQTVSTYSEGRSSWPVVKFSLRPLRYQKRRWLNPDALEEVLSKHTVVSLGGGEHIPPSRTGTDVMPWGLYNERYGSPDWALCYSGQFWAAINIGAGNEYKRTERDLSLHRYDGGDEQHVPAGKWINYPYARAGVADVFRFAGKLASAFHSSEQLAWSATAQRLNGTIVATTNFASPYTCSRQCTSPSAHSDGVEFAEDFAARWTDYCVEFLHEMFGMFDFLGDRIPREAFEKWLTEVLAGRRRSV